MAKPLIQMALDSLDFDATVALAEQVAPSVDIFEIGTPCIKHNGVNLVKELRSRFPDKLLLVDLKTMDAGEYEQAIRSFEDAQYLICWHRNRTTGPKNVQLMTPLTDQVA